MAAAEAARAAIKDVGASVGKQLVGNYSLKGLALAWDNRSSIRDRLRARNRLLLSYDMKLKVQRVVSHVEKTVPNVRTNADVLSPVLHLIRTNKGLLPCIDRIIEEIGILYGNYELQIDGELVYHDAWAIRQMVSVIKGEHSRLVAELKKPNPKRRCKDPEFKHIESPSYLRPFLHATLP